MLNILVPTPLIIIKSTGSASAFSIIKPFTLAFIASYTTYNSSVIIPKVLSFSTFITKKTIFKGKKAYIVTLLEQ